MDGDVKNMQARMAVVATFTRKMCETDTPECDLAIQRASMEALWAMRAVLAEDPGEPPPPPPAFPPPECLGDYSDRFHDAYRSPEEASATKKAKAAMKAEEAKEAALKAGSSTDEPPKTTEGQTSERAFFRIEGMLYGCVHPANAAQFLAMDPGAHP